MPGIEPGAFHMQSERSTTELHPHLKIHVIYQFNYTCYRIELQIFLLI